MGKVLSYIILLSIMFMLFLIPGCGGSGNNITGGTVTNTTGGTEQNITLSFTGYVYAPVDKSMNTQAQPTKTGLITLQDSAIPQNYQPVPEASVYPETNPDQLISTDSSGKFTYDFDARGSREDDVSKRLIIKPTGSFENYAPIRCDIFPTCSDTSNIRKLLLHPNARNIKTGESLQFFAKAVMNDGSTRFIDPSLVTWNVDNENIAAISSLGVITGLSPGTAYVTISIGNLNCTGQIHVRESQTTTYILRGTVTDKSGNAVSNTVVMILGMDSVAITDQAGSYALPGLQGNQDLNVMAYYQGVLRYSTIINLTSDSILNITLPDQPVQSGSLQGMITDRNNSPLSEVLISDGEHSTTTDATGNYNITDIPSGTHKFYFSKSGYVQVTLYIEIKAEQTATLSVLLESSESPVTGTLNGRIIDECGAGIKDALVSYASKAVLANNGSTTTDSLGYFTIANISAGDYQVTAQKLGYVKSCFDVSIASGQNVESRITMDGKIVFTSVRDGNYEIYTMNPDGSEQTRLTNNSSFDCYPSWSPDRSQIAFSSQRDGNREIYIMNSDGTNQTRLTYGVDTSDSYAHWSPDGKRIAFSSCFIFPNFEIQIINTDGSGLTRLTNNTWDDSHPHWSPDGNRLVYASNQVDSYEIYTMNSDGSNVLRLTYDSIADFEPHWSPNGEQITFDKGFKIWKMNSDGTNPMKLTTEGYTNITASWSQSGKYIIFSSNRDGNYEIYKMNNDGSNVTNLTKSSGDDLYAAWAP